MNDLMYTLCIEICFLCFMQHFWEIQNWAVRKLFMAVRVQQTKHTCKSIFQEGPLFVIETETNASIKTCKQTHCWVKDCWSDLTPKLPVFGRRAFSKLTSSTPSQDVTQFCRYLSRSFYKSIEDDCLILDISSISSHRIPEDARILMEITLTWFNYSIHLIHIKRHPGSFATSN